MNNKIHQLKMDETAFDEHQAKIRLKIKEANKKRTQSETYKLKSNQSPDTASPVCLENLLRRSTAGLRVLHSILVNGLLTLLSTDFSIARGKQVQSKTLESLIN